MSMREQFKLTIEVSDIKQILSCGINQAYQLCNSGQFHVVKVGKKIKIPRDGFFDWLEGVPK